MNETQQNRVMNDAHQANLQQYINDVIAMEEDILQALKVQVEYHRVEAHAGLKEALLEIMRASGERLQDLREISDNEGGCLGAVIKEGITAVAGTLAGIYGKVREHPVSRMVRDDIIAMDVAATSYGMLLTLGLSLGHPGCEQIARKGLMFCPGLVVRLTDLMPYIVVGGLAEDGPLSHPAAAHVARAAIRDAWEMPPQVAQGDFA